MIHAFGLLTTDVVFALVAWLGAMYVLSHAAVESSSFSIVL